MPCAFISHKALARSFSPETFQPEFTKGIQPSFIGKPIEPDEVKSFNWDIKQRLQRMESNQTPKREKDRYFKWKNRFGDLFDKEGNLKSDKIPNYFVPGTAKTLSLYFQRKKKQ